MRPAASSEKSLVIFRKALSFWGICGERVSRVSRTTWGPQKQTQLLSRAHRRYESQLGMCERNRRVETGKPPYVKRYRVT